MNKNAYSKDELAHFGIKGMRWGVRRYQNDDGTLTAAGKKRYHSDDGVTVDSSKQALYDKENAKLQKLNERSTKRKQDLDEAFTQDKSVAGKDKPITSRAEKAAKNVQGSVNEVGNIVDVLDRSKRRKIQKAIDEETAKELEGMNDQELRDRINRMNLERQYSNLKYGDIETGYETAKDILDTVGSLVAIAGGIAGVVATVHTLKKG